MPFRDHLVYNSQKLSTISLTSAWRSCAGPANEHQLSQNFSSKGTGDNPKTALQSAGQHVL